MPRVSLRRTDTHEELMLIADNKALSRDLAGKVLPQVSQRWSRAGGRGDSGGLDGIVGGNSGWAPGCMVLPCSSMLEVAFCELQKQL